MTTRILWCAAFCLTGLLAASAPRAVEVRLQVSEGENVARAPATVTSGVPFAKGELRDVSRLALKAGGKPVPAQFAKTVAWDDGSVRWALLDTQAEVPAGGKVELMLSDSGANPAPAEPVRVEDGAESVKISTGGMTLTLGKKKPGLFESLKIDGKERLTSAGKGLVIVREDGGEALAGAPSEVKVECSGPMRAVVCLRGKFPGLHKDLIGYTARVTVLAGQKRLKVHLWLENGGADGQGDVKPEWFAFDGMAVELGLGLGGEVTARCEGVESKGRMRVLQVCNQGPRDRANYAFEDLAYTIAGSGGELKKGDRTDGVMELSGGACKLTAAVRDFWQNYEKAMELDAGKLRVWLWPVEGQWPRPGRNLEHEQIRRLKGVARDKLYLLPGSVHKGYEFVLDVSGRPAAETRAELVAPLFALAPAERYAATGALPGFFAPPGVKTGNKECDFKLASWGRMSRSIADLAGEASILAARREHQGFNIGYFGDSSQWYGWMDFGDLSVPGVGQVSLHYDWPLLAMLEYLRAGDPHALRLAGEMIRHRIDVDQYWSDRDPPEVNRVQRGCVWPAFHANGRSGGPSPGGTWTAGPALWYMLTGEPKAREACMRSVEGLAVAWEKISATKVYGGGTRENMAANGWTIESFCAAYDLTADRRWLDEALKLFNGNVLNKRKSHGPHLHAAGKAQIFGQDYLKEDEEYCHAIAPLCLLHRHTGDAGVLKLLTEGCEVPFPQDSYFSAPVYLAGLFAYVGSATDRPEYLKKAADLFAQGFPESKCPPVFLPDNKTWSARSAMILRAGWLLQYTFAARKDAGQRVSP